MKINKVNGTTRFEYVKQNECFLCNDKLYLKTDLIKLQDDVLANAVNLETGNWCVIKRTTSCTIVDAVVEYYEGTRR